MAVSIATSSSASAMTGGSGSSIGGQQRFARDQARAAAVGQEAARPADEHDDPVGEPDQVRDVDAEPQQPRGEAALAAERAQPRDVRHAGEPADDRDVALVAVPERLVRPIEHPAPDDAGRVRPALDAALGDARRGLPFLPRLHGGIADHEDLRMAGHGQVRADEDPAVAVRLGAGRLGDATGERGGEHAGAPTAPCGPG